MSLISHPEDGKPDNFQRVEEIVIDSDGNPRSIVYLISIDNDRAFTPALIKDENEQEHLVVKTFLFTLPQMTKALSSTVIEEFLELNVAQVLDHWLIRLENYEKQSLKLFNPEEQMLLAGEGLQAALTKLLRLFSSNSNDISVIPLLLIEGLVSQLTQRYQKIQKILRKKSKTTPLQLLETIDKPLFHFYAPAFDEYPTPLARFDAIAGSEYTPNKSLSSTEPNDSALSTREYLTQSSEQQTLTTLQGQPISIQTFLKTKQNQIQQARKELEMSFNKRKTREQMYQQLLSITAATVADFQAIRLDDFKARVTSNIDFNDPTLVKKQNLILKALEGTAFNQLQLLNCPLDMGQLQRLLSKSPQLTEIKLMRCLKKCAKEYTWSTRCKSLNSLGPSKLIPIFML